MAYLRQEGENNCGAFVIAYYLWLKQDGVDFAQTPLDEWTAKDHGGDPDSEEYGLAKDYIKEIYADIQFGDAYGDLKDYCNPFKMIKYLNSQGVRTQAFMKKDIEEGEIKGIFDLITQIDKKLIPDEIMYADDLLETLKAPNDYKACLEIVLYTDIDRHYLLTILGKDGKLYAINPWDAVPQERSKLTNEEFIPTNCGILLS